MGHVGARMDPVELRLADGAHLGQVGGQILRFHGLFVEGRMAPGGS